MRKRVVFVFPIQADGSVLLHLDSDSHRPTFGKYIPPHRSTAIDAEQTDAELGYDALNAYRITGRIRDVPPHVLPYERGEIHYLTADVHYYDSQESRQFSRDDVRNPKSGVAEWVPDIMEAMGLLK